MGDYELLSSYQDKIRKVDMLLGPSVKTLIQVASNPEMLPQASRPSALPVDHIYFPPWLSDVSSPEQGTYLLTRSLCSASLQRVWRLRRRFRWLSSLELKALKQIQSSILTTFRPRDEGLSEYRSLIHSKTFGNLNPLTASQVFRVLLAAGEHAVRSGLGFLAFFSMAWSLNRRFPDPLTIGASLEPWEPTAYVTAKCLLPLRTIQNVSERRAALYRKIGKNVKELVSVRNRVGPRDVWRSNVAIEKLCAHLYHLSEISGSVDTLRRCAAKLERVSDGLRADSNTGDVAHTSLVLVGRAIKSLSKDNQDLFSSAQPVVAAIRTEIVDNLSRERFFNIGEPRIPFSSEFVDSSEYWRDHHRAAAIAQGAVERVLKSLQETADQCEQVQEGDADSIQVVLEGLANANEKLIETIDDVVQPATRWCRNVVGREIAHASAGDYTAFDPSELASGIAVAVRWELMTSPLEVEDSLQKVLVAARPDGSWSPGQPIYTPSHTMGVTPFTSDIVWMITSALKYYPSVSVADKAIDRYVEWLQVTQTTIALPDLSGRSLKVTGWSSERLRQRRKIHFSATALSINALLEIRDLLEYRVWELCKRRFAVIRNVKELDQIEPVDLGVRHNERLHRQLARTARDAQNPESRSATYSVLLHGPPGSSKTSVAQALSSEMWRQSSRWGSSEPRLLRITPADFTRSGEARLDSEARFIFELLSTVRGVTILFDEIDDLLRSRGTHSEIRFIDLVVPAMLNRLADLRESCPRQEVSFIVATNYVERIEPALIRKGRIDRAFPVVYPDADSRRAMIERHREELKAQQLDQAAAVFKNLGDSLVRRTAFLPWLRIEALLQRLGEALGENASENVVEVFIQEELTSFLRPTYSDRWGRYKSLELVREYLEHLSAGAADREEYYSLLKSGPYTEIVEAASPAFTEEVLLERAESAWSRRARLS